MTNPLATDYIRLLERRIHNQRVALRENWVIADRRLRDRDHPKLFDFVRKQAKTINQLKKRITEIEG